MIRCKILFERNSALAFCNQLLIKKGWQSLGGFMAKRLVFFIIGLAAILNVPLCAQDNGELVASLVERVGTLEEELRNLRGEIEETRHDLSLLKKSFETLNTDVDFRLKTSENSGDSAMMLPNEGQEEKSGNREKEVEFESIPSAAEAEYERARSLLEKGEYEAAEKAFSSFLEDYGQHERASAALYWMGITHFVRKQYEKAASVFAKVYKDYPKSIKAPESLLKLSKSLRELDRKTDACTALDQLSKEYPHSLTDEISAERSKNDCK